MTDTGNNPDQDDASFQDDVLQELVKLGDVIEAQGSMKDRVLERLDSIKENRTGFDLHARNSRTRIGEWSMFQKVSSAGIAASLMLVGSLWLVSSFGTTTFAQVADNIRKATSYQADVQIKMANNGPNGQAVMKGKYFWRAPSDIRMENELKLGVPLVSIVFSDRPGIEINQASKSYRKLPSRPGLFPPALQLHELPKLMKGEKKLLGKKSTSAGDQEGFEISLKEVDPDAGDGTVRVWFESQTQLPISVQYDTSLGSRMTMTFNNIVWNKPLEDSLFSTEPPRGYAETRTKSVPHAEQVESIISALRTYSSLSDGKYPQVKIVYGDVLQNEMIKLAKLDSLSLKNRLKHPKYASILSATRGFGWMTKIMREDPSAKFNGQTVGANEASKILFEWKSPQGTIQKIFGDLRAEPAIDPTN